MRGLSKPIPEVNYRSKKKKIQGNDKSFKNSAFMATKRVKMTPLVEGGKR